MSEFGGHDRHTPWHELSWRVLAGYLLLVWGVILAMQGLGVQHMEAARILNTYWPVPVALWALYGLIDGLATGSGSALVYLLALLIAVILQLDALHIGHLDAWSIFWAVVVIAVAFEVLRGPNWHRNLNRRWRRYGPASWRLGIGDVDVGYDAARGRRPMHEGHLIGDIRLDLSQVPLEDGETPFELNALIGDITVLVPADLPVSVLADVTVGDIRIFRQSADGLGRRLSYESPGYVDAPRKVRITAHLLVGDITVQAF